MAVTSDMAQLFHKLRTDAQAQQQFLADAQQVLDDYDLTSHEHDAILTRDCDDLRALGLSPLPAVLGCKKASDIDPDVLKRVIDGLKNVLKPVRRLPDRLPFPIPGLRKPVKPPTPTPGPGPPGPTPGPDPPKPDRPGPGPGG